MENLFQVLGVPRGATPEEIKRAYHRLAHLYHPDKAGDDPQAAARFRRVKAAYETLSHPHKREAYEAARSAWIAEVGAVECPACGEANFVTHGARFCGSCDTELDLPASPTLRARTAQLAEEVGARISEELSELLVEGIDLGFARLRQRLGIRGHKGGVRHGRR